MRSPPHTPRAPSCRRIGEFIFSVTSADETAAKVEPLGGKLIAPPFDVMEWAGWR